jgi:sterol 14-demethylase
MTSAMGLGLNSTVILNYDTWSNYLSEAHTFLPTSPSRLALLAFINIPIVAVFLNVLRQLVSSKSSSSTLRR